MKEVLLKALEFYGTKEIVGKQHNPIILKFFQEIGKSWVKDDETSWCSAFVNYCAKVCGFEYSGELTARSWLKIGKEVKIPQVGDIVILWRDSPNSWKGHVGFYIGDAGSNIYVYGGNQSNQAKISLYPKSQILKFIQLNKI